MTTKITLNGHEFYAAFARVGLAASTDEVLPVLNMVKMTAENGRLRLLATDRYRIHVQSVAITEEFAEPITFFLPASVVRDFKRFGWHKARDTGTQAVLTIADDMTVTISTHEATDGAVTSHPTGITDSSSYPQIEKLLITALKETATAEERKDCVCLNPRFLADLDKARRAGHNSTAPLIIEPANVRSQMVVAQFGDDTDFRAVIMSVRLNSDVVSNRASAHEQVVEAFATA